MPKVKEKATEKQPVTGLVDTIDALNELLDRVQKAQKEFSKFSQEQVDKIFKAAATAADKARIPLARMAVEETGMGVLEDKIIKNHFASEYIYNKHKNAKTCGIINVDKEKIRMLESFKATKFQIFYKFIFPSNIKNIFNVIKINVGMAWVGVIVGEFLVSKEGLGYLIMYGGQVFKLDLVMMGVMVLAILAFIMSAVIDLIEKKILKGRD